MTTVAAYVRISQDRAGDRWGVETQRQKIGALVEARGWTVTEWYEDNDLSASKPRGPKSAWAKMLVDGARDAFELVVAVDVDRLLRSTKDLNTLIDAGLKVVTVDGEIDLSTADGEFRATMLAAIARFETRRKAERTRRSNERRRREGMPVLSGKRPFGYTSGGETIPAQAEAIKKAYSEYLGGVSIKRIAQRLNDDGHLTARGTSWSTWAARYLLDNPLYAGFIRYSETGELFPVKDGEKFQPIVSEEVWRASSRKLANNKSRTTHRGNTAKYLLSGVATCGRCGANMVAGTNDRGLGVYRCGAKFHLTRRREPVDGMVKRTVLALWSREDLARGFALYDAQQEDKDAAQRQELRTERTALESRVEELTEMLTDPAIPTATIKKALSQVDSRLAEIDEKMTPPVPSPLSGVAAAVAGAQTPKERRDRAEAHWKELGSEGQRRFVKATMNIVIQPAKPGVTTFDPSKVEMTWKPWREVQF